MHILKKMLIHYFLAIMAAKQLWMKMGQQIFVKPKLTIFEVKPSIHRLAYETIARTHSNMMILHFLMYLMQVVLGKEQLQFHKMAEATFTTFFQEKKAWKNWHRSYLCQIHQNNISKKTSLMEDNLPTHIQK